LKSGKFSSAGEFGHTDDGKVCEYLVENASNLGDLTWKELKKKGFSRFEGVGHGLVTVGIGTEIEPSKCSRATANLKEAGLEQWAEVRLGDALETLREVPEPVDLVFLDGWKDLYLPVLELVKPRLRPGAVVIADNIFTFRKALRPYVEYMQSGNHGFESTTLKIADGFEFSVHHGRPDA